MKLVYKNILINTLISIIILALGELSIYSFLRYKIDKEAVEHLMVEKHFMLKKLKKGINIENFNNNIGDEITVVEIKKAIYTQPIIETAEVEEEWEEESFTSRKLIFDTNQNGKIYRVTILKTIDEDEDLISNMELIMFVSALSMILILLLINLIVFNKLFAPLYKLIHEIETFSVQKLKRIQVPKTSTIEFEALGTKVGDMSEMIISDYTSMKEFNENITHEIQTPLAVISSKIERCLQDKNLTEEQAIAISDATKAVNKLFGISKGLSLLSKLDNQQYPTLNEIEITQFTHQRINYFSDFIETKKIKLEEQYTSPITINIDSSLCEILIDNLIKNAVKHNVDSGTLYIKSENNTLTISNTGAVPTVSTEVFFKRFSKYGDANSLGLGLSIVKKIADYYSFKIDYTFKDGLHSVAVSFSNKT